MSSDQEGLKALLEGLRSSNALANLINPPIQPSVASSSAINYPNALPPPSQDEEIAPSLPSDSSASSRVKLLLAKLGANPTPPAVEPQPPARPLPVKSTTEPMETEYAPSEPDFRNLSYHQSLSHMSRILQDEKCVSALRQLQKEQEDLEKQLWEARNQIIRRHGKKVKDKETQEKILTGSSELSQDDSRRLDQDLERALKKFDVESVFPAWDGMLTRQQTMLEKLRIPTIYPTRDSNERLRQQKIVRVLEEGLKDGMMS